MITLDVQILSAAAFTTVSGIIYGFVIHAWRKADPDSGLSPLWVAIGCTLGIIALGILHGVEAAASLSAIFIVLGIPQVVSYYISRIEQRKAQPATTAAPSFLSMKGDK